METHTTNIADLPIDHIPQSNELPEHTLHPSTRMDSQVYEPRQKVSFNKNIEIRKIENITFKDTHKMIILASLIFILFNEIMIRNYIMNILVVIFGSSLKTENGTTSKLGNIFYGLFFSFTLYIITLVIDIPSLSF